MGLDGVPSDAPPGARAGAAIAAERLLFLWLSPSFPVGAFAYSQGLEMAAEHGFVRSRADLQDWLSALIHHGSLRTDLIILSAAHRGTNARDREGLVAVNELACALQPSAERHLETTQQGGSFLTAIAGAWTTPEFATVRRWLEGPVAYPVAVALAAAAHGIPRALVLDAYAFAWATALTSAAIRLSIIGQTDAQRILAALATDLSTAARAAETRTLDDIGTATFSADLCSLEHETQYSRLFRS